MITQGIPATVNRATSESWANPSILGSTLRGATDILMSAYDTNPTSTDHTTAFQAAFTAAAAIITAGAAKVRIILDSRQKYTIGGAVTAGSHGEFAQIVLPFFGSAAGAPSGAIQLVGQPRGNNYSYIGGGLSGTVIESTITSAPTYSTSTGIASIFGGPASFCSAHTPSGYPGVFNFLRFELADITIRASAPVICGIDAGFCTGFGWDGLLQFDRDDLAGEFPQDITAPGFWASLNAPCSAPQAIPLITPFHLDWYGTLGDTLSCSGWLGGPVLGEFVHMRRCFVFYNSGGAVLNLDASNQSARIEYLIDWNNAYGIAQASPAVGATPQSPQGTAPGSGQAGFAATPVEIGTWEIQTSQGGSAPSSTQRVYDGMDTGALAVVDCASWVSTTDANGFNAAPKILGSGSSLTGYAGTWRVKTKFQPSTTGNSPGMPATTVPIRNPYGRDALVSISGGTYTVVKVNTATTGSLSLVVVPANGIIAITYSVAPSWNWQLI